jgi:hypothetical protein
MKNRDQDNYREFFQKNFSYQTNALSGCFINKENEL